MNVQAGFTLLELLVTVAIIGMIIMVGSTPLIRYQRALQLQSGTEQFARDADAARSEAKRSNFCIGIGFLSASSYSVRTYATRNCSDTPTVRAVNLPRGLALAAIDNGAGSVVTSAEFRPPYGMNTGTAAVFTLTSAGGVPLVKTVRLTGLTGKVVVR